MTERLTDKTYCISDIRAIQKEVFYEDMECRHGFDLYTGKAIDKLAEYEDLEEQGRLLKLPCAVGDIVYVLRIDNLAYMMNDEKVWEIIEEKFEIRHFDCINKTVFLARPDAERALAEMEGKK